MTSSLPKDVYVTFAGQIDQQLTQRVFRECAIAVPGGVERIHLLIQSPGGSVEEGIALYNFLKNLPIEIITYNGGSVASIAVLVYLAGKVRKASCTASFMIHKTSANLPSVVAEVIERMLGTVLQNDRNVETILRNHIVMPDDRWIAHERGDLTLSASEAMQFALVHEISDFSPPAGSTMINI